MTSAPILSDAKWRKIGIDLPTTRRDRLMISALLFRTTTGQSVRETAAVFGVAKTKLHEWGNALEGVLPGILQTLQLEPAGLECGVRAARIGVSALEFTRACRLCGWRISAGHCVERGETVFVLACRVIEAHNARAVECDPARKSAYALRPFPRAATLASQPWPLKRPGNRAAKLTQSF